MIDVGMTVVELDEPRQRDGDREAGNHEHGDKSAGPLWKEQLVEDNVGNLDQQPADDQVRDCSLEYAPAFQRLEQADVFNPYATRYADDDA